MLTKIKLLLGINDTSKDALLTLLIDEATAEAEAYTKNSDDNALDEAIILMVVYNYNRLGTEGLDSEGYSGVSFGYSADYPENIMRILRSKCRLRIS